MIGRTHVNYWPSVMRSWEDYAVNWSATNSRLQRRLPIRPNWPKLWTRAMDTPENWKNYCRLGSWRYEVDVNFYHNTTINNILAT